MRIIKLFKDPGEYINQLNLRQKFSIPTGMVLFICFAVFALYMLIDQNKRNVEILKSNSEKYAELIVLSNLEYIWNYDNVGLKKSVEAFYAISEISSISIIDNNGRYLINLDTKNSISREAPIRKDIYKHDQKIGELELVVTRDEYNRNLYFIILKLLALFIVIFSITIQSVRLITRRVLKPLDEMLLVADKISEGDLTHGIDVRSGDEIGKLADSFNNMRSKLRESISSIKSIIEFMPSILIQFDRQGRIIGYNRLAEKFIGISSEEAQGKYLKDIKPELAVFLFNIDSPDFSEKPRSFYRINLTGYKNMFFNLFIFLLKHEHSESLVLRIDDITELEKKDKQLRHVQKIESIGLLASGVAHDFNNILGSILATASLLKYMISKGRIEKPEDMTKDLDLIEKSCEYGASIAAELLNLSKKESDIELHNEDLNQILEQIGKICSNSFDKSISISISKYSEEATAMINTSQIQQVMLNLCINASHSMTIMRKPEEPAGGKLSLSITKLDADCNFIESRPEVEPGEYWLISVKDTGVGMDRNTLSRIFDPFFTTKIKSSVKGTGLGLSIAYSIIKAHSGFIDVYSEVGIGTVFSIYLPVYNKNRTECKESNEAAKSNVIRGYGTILVVDDEESILNTSNLMLSECGYDVITGTNGEEAVELYKKNSKKIRAVLLDTVMPVKSGLEALIELKRINPHLKVLMTSGLDSDELIKNIIDAGASGFIKKPASIEQLSSKLHSIIAEK